MDSDDSACALVETFTASCLPRESALKCRKIERLAWENLRAAIALHFAYYNSAASISRSASLRRWKRALPITFGVWRNWWDD